MKKLLNLFCRSISKSISKSEAIANHSVERGKWGEEMAVKHLRSRGWRILERNSRPCRRDRRCELDIIAFDPGENKIIFVEVKTHISRQERASRLWGISAVKKKNLLRASANWLMRRHWHGNWRFDVLEVYGKSESYSPEIDHIENVKLFPPNWRFW
jgi:putative endonuclease